MLTLYKQEYYNISIIILCSIVFIWMLEADYKKPYIKQLQNNPKTWNLFVKLQF